MGSIEKNELKYKLSIYSKNIKDMEPENKSQEHNFPELIMKGLTISFKKLVLEKQKDNEELIFFKDGKIEHIKARDLTVI